MTKDFKVFGIGLSRTGTRSLVQALNRLGWTAIHFPQDLAVFDGIYNAGADISVALNFRMLADKYPDSKFIYTTRSLTSWLASCEWQWEHHPPNPRMSSGRFCEEMYGTLEFDREAFIETRSMLERDVIDFFSESICNDLCLLNICELDSAGVWTKLLDFLGFLPTKRHDVPKEFPQHGARR